MSKGRKFKKPLSKKVVALNEQLQRLRGVRDLEKRFLIVCEDDKSAPNYFNALKKHYNLTASSIRIAGSGGKTQPIQVVERAIEIKEMNNKTEDEPFDQIWCVIDGDYGSKINNARNKAKANDIKLAISTKCFEYWVLLHFEENDTATMDCDGMVHVLKDHLTDYQKGSCDFCEVVTRATEACTRAEKLRKPGIDRGDKPEDQNPCSEVYLLVNAILKS
ncbi:RloB family protein [Zavarzinella formosa]|uniref:RloB family protein n=1 Tax=Zavarzinella formosa TaxID=360055 RepID=UPI00037A4E74|nr:RloB family protein [Zavarzinella formosa]